MNVNLPNGHMEEEFLIFCLSTCSGNKDSCLDVFRYARKLSFFYDRVLVYFGMVDDYVVSIMVGILWVSN